MKCGETIWIRDVLIGNLDCQSGNNIKDMCHVSVLQQNLHLSKVILYSRGFIACSKVTQTWTYMEFPAKLQIHLTQHIPIILLFAIL